MRTNRDYGIVTLLLAVSLIVACGDDDASSTDTGLPADTPMATGESSTGQENGGAAEAGAATLTIGDESWAFDRVSCGFTPEQTRNARVSFTLGARATFEGVRLGLDVTIQDPLEEGRYEGDDVIHSVTLEDVDLPAVIWSAGGGLVGGIRVDGKRVTAEGEFRDRTTDQEIRTVQGRLEATCP